MEDYLKMSIVDKIVRDIIYGPPYTTIIRTTRHEPHPIHNPHGSTAIIWELVNGSRTTIHGISTYGEPGSRKNEDMMQAYNELTAEQISSLSI